VDDKKARRNEYIPGELCEVLPGQIFQGNLPSEKRTPMIEFAAKKPEENVKSIYEDGRDIFGFNGGKSALVCSF
jgi:hypothetical protein